MATLTVYNFDSPQYSLARVITYDCYQKITGIDFGQKFYNVTGKCPD